MDADNDPDENGKFDDAVHQAWLKFEERLDDPAAEKTVRLSIDIPIKWAALSHWRALRHKQRWAESTAPPDGEFPFAFTEQEWSTIRDNLLNTLNNAYEDQFHALNNGFSALLTHLSKNESKHKHAATQADLLGLNTPDNPDEGIPF